MIYKGVVFFCGPKNDSTGIDMKTIHYYGLHSTWYLSKPRIDDEGCADYEYFVAEGSKAYYGHWFYQGKAENATELRQRIAYSLVYDLVHDVQ